jgi:hypothetical protein
MYAHMNKKEKNKENLCVIFQACPQAITKALPCRPHMKNTCPRHGAQPELYCLEGAAVKISAPLAGPALHRLISSEVSSGSSSGSSA